MAEIEFGETGVGTPPLSAAKVATIVNWLGSLVSVTLIAGLAWWGYQLFVRDVSGVPVVRALEGPMRVAPLDPGGISAAYQGLAVNNIAAVGEAEVPADRLVLAPKPTVLNSDDPTTAALQGLQEATSTAAADAAAGEKITEQASAPEPNITTKTSVSQGTDRASLIEATLQLLEIDSQAEAAGTSTDSAAPATTVPHDEPVDVGVAGVSTSLRPVLRPSATLASVPVAGQATPVAANPVQVADRVAFIDPGDIPAGTRLAQLGAFESAEVARAEWLKISTRFEDFMTGKTRVIEKAQSGGQDFYRLRVHGFDDLSDARRFCSALLAAQANCIPVVTR